MCVYIDIYIHTAHTLFITVLIYSEDSMKNQFKPVLNIWSQMKMCVCARLCVCACVCVTVFTAWVTMS